ncbi:MAG: DUF4159 domain-containing protein [Planctomycetes bacterium]|nr:DUF4159 domain-containing protein [Planctomycetota bacterium]
MIRFLLTVALALCVGGVVAVAPTRAQPPADAKEKERDAKNAADTKLVQAVQDSIARGVKYLKRVQTKQGNWEDIVIAKVAGLEGGTTSLAVLALLNSGLSRDDETVARALVYLRKLGIPAKTYVVALQTMAFAEARDKKDVPAIERNVEWLKKHAIYKGGKLEGWSYPMNQIADASNTQYALLGLYAAKTAGVDIGDDMWKAVKEFYTRTQLKSGASGGYWTYYDGDTAASFTMTVAGACGLWIANMGLDASEQGLDAATGVAANCGRYSEDSALAKGMHWIGSQFNFLEGKSYFYNYYGIERLGRLSGQRFIGQIDWYREGCERLIKMQEADGSFISRLGQQKHSVGVDTQPVIASSFALLFLSKGRTPVLVSKFAWGNYRKAEIGKAQAVLTELDPRGNDAKLVNWNRKHNDCRNLVEFASRELFDGAPLSWQVYDPRLQDLTDDLKIDSEVGLLLQSPVVYLNGHGAMPFVGTEGELLSTPERILQKYVEEGGFLVGEACCGDVEFARSFEKLIGRIFKGSTLKKLPPEHAIWTMFPGVSPADFPDLEYLDRGCRTVAVFSPSPLAGYWEERRFMPKEARNPKNRGEKAYCLARNVIAYATGMELPKPKLTKTILAQADSGIARSKFRALQLQYINDKSVQPPPASDALRNLMQFLKATAKLDVTMNSEVLTPTDQNVAKYKFLYLHGRKPVQFTPDESDAIKANLKTGGLLLADAACQDIKGWRTFDESFRASMKAMWGRDLELIPQDDPVFKMATASGIDLNAVRCRRERADGSGPEPELRSYRAHLEGIREERVIDGKLVKGRWLVVYSKYDIGCAIEGHKSADCLGHDKESALKVASAVVLYSLKR